MPYDRPALPLPPCSWVPGPVSRMADVITAVGIRWLADRSDPDHTSRGPWGLRGLGPRASTRGYGLGAGWPQASQAQLARQNPGGHGKSELSTALRCPLYGDRPAVRLDQALDDVESEPRATAALGPPELPEDPRLEFRRDTVALVPDGDRDAFGSGADGTGACGFQRLDHDSYGTSAVPYGVLNKVPEYLVDLVRVEPRLGQPTGDHHPVPVGRVAGRHPPRDELLHPFRHADKLPVDFHPPRLDPGHIEQFGDEPGDPVRVGVDGLQHHFLLVVGEPAPFGQQRRGEALHAGQRGPQLVRHGGHQVGAAALQAGPLLRTAQHEHQALDLAARASRVALW